jgi:hypothetical protein
MRQSINFYLVFAVYFHSSFPVCINSGAGRKYLLMLILFLQSTYTPAPTGYEPFYISHYGRHGSR